MAEDTDEDEEDAGPVVELGEGESVEGAPLARVAARLHWPVEHSELDRKEGDATIRTPDGPRELSSVLADVEETYFESRQAFVDAVREVVGTGAVPTADE